MLFIETSSLFQWIAVLIIYNFKAHFYPLSLTLLYLFRCTNDLGSGPLWCQPIGNACECDRPFLRRVYNLTQNCSTTSCRFHALQIHVVFKLLSCWYRKRTCFPVIRTKCRCSWCLCPRIRISTKCVVLKRCAFFGSGKV